MNWQSILSTIPPCPGKMLSKSFKPNALFIPEAKNPPKGEMREVKIAKTIPNLKINKNK